MRLFFVLGIVIFHHKTQLQNLLIKQARYATMNTRERVVNAPFGCSKWAECGYPKSQDEVKYLTQYLKKSLDIVLDAKTFVVLGKSGF